MLPQPLVVSADECEHAVLVPELIEEIAQGFIDYTAGRVVVPPVGYLGFTEPAGDVHLKYGYVKGGDVFVVKVAAGFPQNSERGLPTGDGCMLVFDSHTGFLLAVLLDRSRLTDLRTAVAGAVAARALAPKTISRIGIIGTGVQARLQPLMLKHVTACRDVMLYGRSASRMASCAHYLEAADFRVTIGTSAEAVAEACELIVTTTASHAAHFRAAAVRPGTHITGVGADAPGKQELDVKLFSRAEVVVADSIAQCADHGDLAPALATGDITLDRVRELGTVLANPTLGRTSEQQISIADLTGVAVQDIVIASHVMRRNAAAPLA
ncbi:MAG: ornithine cyclodeaminase family protein [Gemmatimonadota bacterium]|nr:ornithine cyclodeaminase family protein [Gemmatimonadota bacterium]